MLRLPTFHPKHETHRETLLRFIVLVLILSLYCLYLVWQYGTSTGFGVTALTWSFFVLCTPIADGGFVIAFPIRLLFGIKMAITQIVLWFVAMGINIVALLLRPTIYQVTFLTKLLKHILITPYPAWSILVLSAIGTFLSIFFADEMMNVISHQHRALIHKHGFKYRIIVTVVLVLLTVTAYYFLINKLHLEPPQLIH